MKKRSHHHVVYNLSYHLVLVTKYRHKCISPEIFNFLQELFVKKFESEDMKVLEFNGEEDHIHILFEGHPSIDLSKLINNLKTTSSRLVRKEFSEELSKFYWKPYFWNRGYCISSTGGAILEVIKKYISEKQECPS